MYPEDELRQAQNELSQGSGDTNPNQAGSEKSSPSSSFWKQSLWSTEHFQQRWNDMVNNACTISPCHLWEVPNEPPVVAVSSTDEIHPPTDLKPNDGALSKQPTAEASLNSLSMNAKVSNCDSVRPTHAAMEGTPQEDHKAESKRQRVPLETLHVRQDQTLTMERNISELTMRSCYTATLPTQKNEPHSKPQRRMAYYAVGKHHQQTGRGGNRRCYFTGKLIMDGTPFYAGSVEQGLRTLVVFCLPSALNLPDPEKARQCAKPSSTSRRSWLLGGSNGSRKGPESVTSRSVTSKSYGGSRASRMSSLDDLSMSIDGDLDPNWNLDRSMLLQILPPANKRLLQQMADMYGDQFETLPVQVRDASVWKLYVKFCFFSGLPIEEGELHYKVRDSVAEAVYGEEIALSHEVMEASTTSAEILSLPNRTVLQYLRQNYTQQCSKLDDRVFQRENWERVAPEV
ncbi:hypothetical protein FisN_7Hh039 [Fistulifera solaris]|uniref:Uncharacterized protein n=1 Tax=Fistulifera solaris TaxID=1519565 RepID=A0A1Z5K3E9_FISSO|nr:hypothetical protein FisN_7Hh039 [Fistulifera solaris]|eukprot:GAX20729.1 hypothetical protein FisN_7Hh039 [Fistulifera solaris]